MIPLIVIIKLISNVDSTTIDCRPPFDKVTIPGTTIISPNYPNAYGNSSDCQLVITFATKANVSLTFEDFNVEGHSSCRYDYLALYDGSSISSPMVGSKLCGTRPAGTTMNSTGNSVTLHFVSDNSETRTGFKIRADAKIGRDILEPSNFPCIIASN